MWAYYAKIQLKKKFYLLANHHEVFEIEKQLFVDAYYRSYNSHF